jgi:thiaminase
VGGVFGFSACVQALQDPNHEEHESYIEWCGNYDSERFDPESINWELMKYLRWSRDRYQRWGWLE